MFYPDCKFSTTTVLGEVINEDGPKPEKIEFKVSGKEILEAGAVVMPAIPKNADDDDAVQPATENADSGNGAKKAKVEKKEPSDPLQKVIRENISHPDGEMDHAT